MKKRMAGLVVVVVLAAVIVTLLIGDFLHNRNYLSGLESAKEKEEIVYRVGNICLLKEKGWETISKRSIDIKKKTPVKSLAYRIQIMEKQLKASITVSPIDLKISPIKLYNPNPVEEMEETFEAYLLFDNIEIQTKIKLVSWDIIKTSAKRATSNTIYLLVSKDMFITRCRNSRTLEIMSALFPGMSLEYDLTGFNDVYKKYRESIE